MGPAIALDGVVASLGAGTLILEASGSLTSIGLSDRTLTVRARPATLDAVRSGESLVAIAGVEDGRHVVRTLCVAAAGDEDLLPSLPASRLRQPGVASGGEVATGMVAGQFGGAAVREIIALAGKAAMVRPGTLVLSGAGGSTVSLAFGDGCRVFRMERMRTSDLRPGDEVRLTGAWADGRALAERIEVRGRRS
jgi:hypothetical protein